MKSKDLDVSVSTQAN